MPLIKPEMVRSWYADTAITANKVVCSSATNAHAVRLPAATTNLTAIGITTQAADSNQWITVAHGGNAQATAGGTIAVGDLLGFDTSGQVVAITPSGSGTTLRGTIGTAQSAGASGELVDVFINPGYCQV
jgi:hypothetical protein